MTWKEFKAEIDRQLKEQSINEDTQIRYIDISYPDATRKDVKASLDDDLLGILDLA